MSEAPLRVLVVEDDETGREVLDLRLQDWGYAVDTARTLAQALRRLDAREPDIVVADVVLPDGKGLDILERLEDRNVRSPVIFITAHGSADLAVEAMKAGARDFLTKPLDYDKLRTLVDAAGEEVALRAGIRELETELESDGGPGPLVGRSPEMREVFQMVELLAEKDASAIVTGETGTGKELVARAIHDLSDRADGPFVAVNAAAIPEGLIESELFGHEKGAFTGATHARQGSFELADGGTLLLDEIAEMPVDLQPKLLRILEEERTRRVGGSHEIAFDARVLAATNRDPEAAVEDGDLRDDLFYRLNVFHVRVPALRERPEDIPLLAQHFVRLFNDKHDTSVDGLRPEALDLLERYSWPGNVRELRNVVERAVVVAGTGLLEPSQLPPYLKEDGGDGAAGSRVVLPVGDVTAAEAEKELILRTLEHVGGNKAEAARRLDLDPKTIRNKLKRWAEEEEQEDDDGEKSGR